MNKEENYEKIVQISNDFFEKYIAEKLNENDDVLAKKEELFHIVLKLFNTVKEESSISLSKEEVNFLLDYDVYKELKEIIEELKKIN